MQNEARALTAMSKTSLAANVPKLIGFEGFRRKADFGAEFRQRQSSGSASMTSQLISFLQLCLRQIANSGVGGLAKS